MRGVGEGRSDFRRKSASERHVTLSGTGRFSNPIMFPDTRMHLLGECLALKVHSTSMVNVDFLFFVVLVTVCLFGSKLLSACVCFHHCELKVIIHTDWFHLSIISVDNEMRLESPLPTQPLQKREVGFEMPRHIGWNQKVLQPDIMNDPGIYHMRESIWHHRFTLPAGLM